MKLLAKIFIVIAIANLCYMHIGASRPDQTTLINSVLFFTTFVFAIIGLMENRKSPYDKPNENNDCYKNIVVSVLLGWAILAIFICMVFIYLVVFVP